MNLSFGTLVARHRRPHFRHSSASELPAHQLHTSRFVARGISTPTPPAVRVSTQFPDHFGDPSFAFLVGAPLHAPRNRIVSPLVSNQGQRGSNARRAPESMVVIGDCMVQHVYAGMDRNLHTKWVAHHPTEEEDIAGVPPIPFLSCATLKSGQLGDKYLSLRCITLCEYLPR